MNWLTAQWQHKTWLSLLLLPLSWFYCVLMGLRRAAYGLGPLRSLPVPVIIVGNITVGGTGKTPLVLWLASWLQEQAWRPAIVSRGYGGQARPWSRRVQPGADAREVGDEPLLLAQRSGVPVIVDRRRRRAAMNAVVAMGCDIVISDDGLQHLALPRDVEIAVIDGVRRLGNGRCLPAGPLREPAWRLRQVDIIVVNGEPRAPISSILTPLEIGMRLAPQAWINLAQPERRVALADWQARTVHAIAGIGHPQRFFDTLQELGLDVIAHAFPDHHDYGVKDIVFDDDVAVVMTEKDAVKCRRMLGDLGDRAQRYWYLSVTAEPDALLSDCLMDSLKEFKRG